VYKILIVEDDPTIREVLKRHLTKWGYLVQGVHDFQTVLEDVQTVQPHLVLLDISLPFFNGYHWCEQIRTFSQMPILFLSSASDDMNVVMAMNLGGRRFYCETLQSGCGNRQNTGAAPAGLFLWR